MKPAELITEQDDRRNVAFYTELLTRHQISPQALNWSNRASQERRFEVLADIGELNGCSVLDVGCGLGDFFGWRRQLDAQSRYLGVDLTPAMVAGARGRFPEAHFQVGNILDEDFGTFDFVVASGIFYLRQHEPERFLQRMVTRMFKMCRRGLAFNSLSLWSERQEVGEFYADPLRTLEFCRSLTPRVVLRHDYHPADFTIHLLRANSPS